MKENYTHILYVLDRSGSMQSVASDVAPGFNSFIEQQKALAGECTFSLVLFDDQYESVLDFAPIGIVPKLNFIPRGMTALYDAIGKSVTHTGAALAAMPEFSRPDKVMVIIHTDGEENSSKEWKKAQIGEMIKLQEQSYNWKFVFIGTNFDVMGESRDLGVKLGDTCSYTNDSAGIGTMYRSLSRGVKMSRAAPVSAFATCSVFGEEELEDTGIVSSVATAQVDNAPSGTKVVLPKFKI